MDFKTNTQLQLAFDFVSSTGKNIFLTGKAGTGKTTFLRYLKDNLPKRMVVVAPTGVAAINAGGVTIHSFFQLPFGPQTAENMQTDSSLQHRFSMQKRNIIKSMELLIIDEISMVRADLLDAVDGVLRRFRYSNRPFGGVQLLMIGDLQQLPPVHKEEDWGLISRLYDSPWFFSSHALKKSAYITIELQHVYRQKEEEFLHLLNAIRDKKITREELEKLNRHYKPGFEPKEEEGYIILTTHNYKAREINRSKLDALPGKPKKYEALVRGNFGENFYPTDYELELKKGAQVMFIKNDPEPEKRFFNGKIGKVVQLKDEWIKVKCDGDPGPIVVEPLVWQKMKYTIDEKTKEIRETEEGTFTQFPLKTAWAITIHKSQGLTFEKAIIDSEAAFAHGQVYVALSRCRTLDGLVLKSPLRLSGIKTDETVTSYSRRFAENRPDRKQLLAAQREYQKTLIFELFDFERLLKQIYSTIKVIDGFGTAVHGNLLIQLRSMGSEVREKVSDVSAKFMKQVEGLLAENPDVHKNIPLQERIKKGARYFYDQMELLVTDKMDEAGFETDNKEAKKKIDRFLDELLSITGFKKRCLEAVFNGFDTRTYLEAAAKASIEATEQKKKPAKQREPEIVTDEELQHPDLYNTLKTWRNTKAREEGKEVFKILTLHSLRDLSNLLPGTTRVLKKVHGLGKKRIAAYGEELLEIVRQYCKNKGLEPFDIEVKPKVHRKNTKEISFELWKEGKSIEQIAGERNLAPSTIEGHLAFFVKKGEIEIFDLVPEEKVRKIMDWFEQHPNSTMKEAKEHFGDEISYGEMKMVFAYMDFLKTD